MAKVLFINPVIRENENPTFVPYGMAQLAALAVSQRHKVQVLDANAWRPTDSQLQRALASDDWDAIVTGGLITTYGFIKKTVAYARKASKKSLIIAGGGFITPIPHDVMKFMPEIDIGVIGEGYVTLLEILKGIDDKNSDFSGVKGIIYRDKGRRPVLNTERPLIEDIDSLPFPAWDLFPMDIYFKNSSVLLSEEAMLSKRHIGIVASYGCPYRCKYCFHLGLSGELKTVESRGVRKVALTSARKVRCHSPAYVVDMAKAAKEKFGIDFISFLDENFAMLARKKEWFEDFSRRWEAAGLSPLCAKKGVPHDPKKCKGIHWGTTAHVALVNKDILRRFKRLGCAHLDYGLESFSDKILRSIGKGASAKLNEEVVASTLKAGIRPIPNQIIGFPEESFDSIKVNIEVWKRLGIRSYPFFATPYPGSEWYAGYKKEILRQYGGDLEAFLLDLGDATKITAVISKEFNTVELLGLRELMVKHDLRRIGEYETVKKRKNEEYRCMGTAAI